MLIDSGHHAIVGSLKPMRGTGLLIQSEHYPGSTDKVMDDLRSQGNFTHHRLINSLAWHQLNELRGMKLIIVSDSTIDPTVNFPYLHDDVAVVAMPQLTLQQRAALMASITQTIEQATPIIIMFGFIDHLDLEGHLKKLLSPNLAMQDIHDAIVSFYHGCLDARNKLVSTYTRVIFVSSPGYWEWPQALQKVTALVASMYRKLEVTLCAGNMKLDANLRPYRIDDPRMMAELSKTAMSMPLIESLELTLDDCVLREHNEYMKLLQPRGDDGVPLQPPAQLLQMVEKSMQIVGDGVGSGQRKHCTRAARENLDKISKKMQDVRQQHKGRLPKPEMIIEVKTFDQVEEAN